MVRLRSGAYIGLVLTGMLASFPGCGGEPPPPPPEAGDPDVEELGSIVEGIELGEETPPPTPSTDEASSTPSDE